ncbi:MAG: glycerol-3-phosphate dehydrogenase [Oleiphilaceae bacterium]|jgi:glycerol-3-phosphate dehydrogenase
MNHRITNIQKLQQSIFDVAIVGAGINGAVAAAALSAKGVKVALIDKGDFAGFTSSNSSNLAWGGIKYLESHEYRLVNGLCKSRNLLMKSYPSTVKEIRFLTSIQKGFRMPVSFVYLGTILYWVFGRFITRAPTLLSRKRIEEVEQVINTSSIQGGFEYSDCYLYDNDARFVFNFVRSAMNYGCIAANYVEAVESHREADCWKITAKDVISGNTFVISARCLINAGGPLADTLNEVSKEVTEHHHLFSKGIHLIVDRVTQSQKVLTFFASDGRLFFVIPMGPKTCIGTTDTQVNVPFTQVTEEDRQFVLSNANTLLRLEKPLTTSDIISERCGVRPLAQEKEGEGIADWVKLSRKHAIDMNSKTKHLTIFGGKLTDCINVGDEVVELIKQFGVAVPYFSRQWYGEPADAIKEEFLHQAELMCLDNLTPATSSEPLTQRLWRRYGRSAISMLETIRQDPKEAQLLICNAEYLRCEIEYAAKYEMITRLEDFLRRRSKISLVVKHDAIMSDPGLKEACQILFGDDAEMRLQEYAGSHS